jgi:cytochrome c-type biogenesis protein CcmH
MTLYAIFATLLAAALVALLWPVRKQKTFCALTATAFIAGALGVYAAVGNSTAVHEVEVHQQKIATASAALVEYSEKVKKNPRDLAAWIALGQAFMETSQWKPAANAFKEAVRLSGGDPRLILAYAKALIFAGDGKVSDHAKKSLEMVVLQDPKNEEARYFLAVRQLQDGNTETAMKNMKELYRSLSEDSPLKQMIDQQIGR